MMRDTTVKKDVSSLGKSLSALKTLTAMQLKEKTDMSFLKSVKKTVFRIVFLLLEFAAITAICFLLFYLIKLLKILDPIEGRISANILTTVMAVMMTLSVIFTTGGLVNSLYLSKDNLVLLTFPAKPTIVFLSKLLVYFIHELKKNFMFLVPLFCAYGIVLGYPVYYYLWLAVNFFFIAAAPVLIASLLSMPALFIFQFVKKYKIVQYALAILGFALLGGLVLLVVQNLPAEINFLKNGIPTQAIADLTAGVAKYFPPISWLTVLLIGNPYAPATVNGIQTTSPDLFTAYTLPIVAGFVLTVAMLVLLNLLLARPLFYKMASKPFEFSKKTKIKERKNNKAPVFLSAFKKEWMVALRDNTVLGMVTQFLVIMPLAIVLLNSLYKAMPKDLNGVQMTVIFNFVIILLIALSANIRIASAYSKDGSSAYLNKVQPSTYGSLLFAKLTVNMVMGLLGIGLTTLVYSFYYTVGSVNLYLFALTAYAIYIAHLFWSAEMDLMNPQYEQYATFSQQSNNPNENKSSLLMFVLALLFALVIFLLVGEGITKIWIKASVVACVIAVFKAFTFFLKIKIYYKEKK